MPECRVDLFEPVDVEHDDGDARVRVDRLLQAIDEQHAVGQPGQPVVQRLMPCPLLCERAIGDVLDREADALVGKRKRVRPRTRCHG